MMIAANGWAMPIYDTKKGLKMCSIKQFFEYKHLPDHLQPASKPFSDLADLLDKVLPDNAEKTTAFRKLLEAKDCAVRAIVNREDS